LDAQHRLLPTTSDVAAALLADIHRRRVAWWERADPQGEMARVSTVFLVADHNYAGAGPPLLFETMAWWPDHEVDEYQERSHTWEEAEQVHRRVVAQVARAVQRAWDHAAEPC
jgi:hypothetical protein